MYILEKDYPTSHHPLSAVKSALCAVPLQQVLASFPKNYGVSCNLVWHKLHEIKAALYVISHSKILNPVCTFHVLLEWLTSDSFIDDEISIVIIWILADRVFS